jgi:hypothetical protein
MLRLEVHVKIDYKQIGSMRWLGSSGSEWEQMEDSCKYGNEIPFCVKCKELLR